MNNNTTSKHGNKTIVNDISVRHSTLLSLPALVKEWMLGLGLLHCLRCRTPDAERRQALGVLRVVLLDLVICVDDGLSGSV